MRNQEKCPYCGQEYHPMLPAIKAGQLIFVCELKIILDGNGDIERLEPTEECKNKALADGYALRPDRKPRR